MMRVAILGGGISGLAAAYELEKARRGGANLKHTIFEASERLGGALRTESRDGFLIELGADSFLSEKSWARELCRELGIEEELIGSNDAERRTWIFVDGKLHSLPAELQFIVPTSPKVGQSEFFSEKTRQKLAEERELKPRESKSDESVASFVERHFGKEYLERVAEPMLAGIYGGDCERLSARAVMQRFLEMERSHGSLQRAVERQGKSGRVAPIFTSLKPGMQTLVTRIAQKLTSGSVRLNSPIERLERKDNEWRVESRSASESFDSVIMTAPTFAAAELVKTADASLAAELATIRYTSSVTVAVAYDAPEAQLPSGFGVLVPQTQKQRMLACTFVHNKFPGRVPEGKQLVRMFFGGAHDEKAGSLSDAELISLATNEVAAIIGLKAKPEFAVISRWPRSMPQYDVGHVERVARIKELATKLPGFALCGSAYEGVGVPDCIRSGREAASRVVERIRTHP